MDTVREPWEGSTAVDFISGNFLQIVALTFIVAFVLAGIRRLTAEKPDELPEPTGEQKWAMWGVSFVIACILAALI